jgi:hypothetical protein
MRDWIAKLDAFLRAGDRQILEHAGSISADEAKQKAELEFGQFDRQRRQLEDAQADAQFAQEVENLAKKALLHSRRARNYASSSLSTVCRDQIN